LTGDSAQGARSDAARRATRHAAAAAENPAFPRQTDLEFRAAELHLRDELVAARSHPFGPTYTFDAARIAERRRQTREAAVAGEGRPVSDDPEIRERERRFSQELRAQRVLDAQNREGENRRRVLGSLGIQRINEGNRERVLGSLLDQRFREESQLNDPLNPQRGFRDIVNGRVSLEQDRAQIHRFGGLAPGYSSAISQNAIAEAQDRLAKVVERQVSVFEPGLSSAKRLALAQEIAAQAYEQNAAVIKSASGKVIGLASLGAEVTGTRQGFFSRAINGSLDEAGRGRFGRLVDRLDSGGFVARQAGTVAGGVGRLGSFVGDRLGANGGINAALLGTAVLPYLGQALGPDERAAAIAARAGGSAEGEFRSRTQTAGTLQGAAIGAAIGLTIGPLGAAVGGAVGAVVGFANSIRQASRDLNDAKLANSVERLNEVLKPVAEGRRSLSSVDATSVQNDIRTARLVAESKANDALEGFFSKKTGVDPREEQRYQEALARGERVERPRNPLDEARTRELRVALGNQVGTYLTALTSEAQRLAKANPHGNPSALTADFAQGLGEDLLRITSDIRGIPLAQSLKEFTDAVREAQENIRVQASVEQARVAAERTATTFDRLSSAVSNATAASTVARGRADVAALAFGGGALRVGGLATGIDQLGAANSTEFNRSLGSLGGVLGGAGGSFAQTGRAADAVSRVLPGVLAELASQGVAANDETVGVRARSLLEDRLGKGNPEIAKAIQVVLGGISEATRKDKGDPFKEVRADAGKFAEKLLEPFSGPFKAAAERIARELEDNANHLVEGLTRFRTNLEQVGEGRDRAADARLGLTRARAEFFSEQLGGGDVNRLLSFGQLAEPFAARQRRLLAGTGLGIEDVGGIAGRLSDVRGRLETARIARDSAAGDQDKFAKAAANFENLVSEAENLQKALRNLADPTQKAAAIQERLNALNADRDSRLGFAERYIQASPEERFRLARGQTLASRLNQNPGDFSSLTDDDKRLALEAAKLVGSSQFSNGRTGNGLANELLRTTGILPAGLEAERFGLLGEKAKTAGTAVGAQDALVKDLSDSNSKFLDRLYEAHAKFFERLASNLVREDLNRNQNALGINRTERGELSNQERQAALLAHGGISTQEQLKLVQNPHLVQRVRDYLGVVGQLENIGLDEEQVKNGVIGRALRDVDQVVSLVQGTQRDERVARSYEGRGGARKFLERQVEGLLPFTPDLAENATAIGRRDQLIAGIVHGSGAISNLPPEAQGEVVEAVKRRFREEFDRNVSNREKAAGGPISDESRKQVAAITLGLITQQEASARGGDAKRILELQRQGLAGELSGSPLNVDRLAGFKGAERDEFLKALAEGFRDPAASLDNLKNRIDQNQAAFGKLTETIAGLTARLAPLAGTDAQAGPVQNRAAGGPIFASRRSQEAAIFRAVGTDTVPAMLSPGEFVVNAKSARANQWLLGLINSSRGAVHLADGGYAFEAPQDGYVFRPVGPLATAEPLPNPYGGTSSPDISTLGPTKVRPSAPRLSPAAALAGLDSNSALGLEVLQSGIEARARARIASGRLNPSNLGRYIGARLLEADASRQVGSLVEQQLYAGAASAPGEEEQFSGAIGRLTTQEERNARRFRQRFGPGFAILAGAKPPKRFGTGGIVTGGSPGRDSVPALLTPGEMVLTPRQARYLAAGGYAVPGGPFAFSIATIEGAAGMAAGGFPAAAFRAQAPPAWTGSGGFGRADQPARGGPVTAPCQPPPGLDPEAVRILSAGFSSFTGAASSLAGALTSFGPVADQLSKALNQMPREIEGRHTVELNMTVNGESVAGMRDEAIGAARRAAVEVVRESFGRFLPEMPTPLQGDAGGY
jgi:hypothetical protein